MTRMKLHQGLSAFEGLLSEEDAIGLLGLHNRPSPKGALRWLMRTGKLAYVRLAKGIYGFRRADIAALIERSRVAAAGQEKGRKRTPGT